MAPVSIPAPITRLSASEDIISFIASTQTLSHDAVSGKPLYASPAVTGPVVEKDLKSKVIKLVATGYAPYGKPLGGEQSVEPVVAIITEDKLVRLIQAETGKVFYERTLIKKASAISVEDDGTVIVSDKNGDVFAYPFVDDSFESANVPKVSLIRPDATALAGDPSLNPDAKLLLGHVSTNTAHVITMDGKHIITADRDEHIRVSRYPEGYVLVRFLFGHKQFVSSLCILPSHPELLLSGGGDPNIQVHNWQTGHLMRQIPILPSLSPFRTVRTAMRRGGKRVRQAIAAEDQKLIAEGKTEEVESRKKKVEDALEGVGIKTKGLTEEEWKTPVRGYVLPEGDRVCVGRMEVVGENVVFFSEGCSSIHSIPIAHAVAPTSVLSAVHSLQLPAPILDFCSLPASASSVSTSDTEARSILLSMDPAWEHRQDGGKNFYPSQDSSAWNKSKRKANKSGKIKGKAVEDVVMDDEEAALNAEGEAGRDLGGFTEEQIREMSGSPFRVVRVRDDGELEDVTASYTDYLTQFNVPTAPVDQVLAIPAYNNLTFYPKWTTEEDEEEVAAAELDLNNPILQDKKGNNRKRALGRLKARGFDVKQIQQKSTPEVVAEAGLDGDVEMA